MSKLSNEILIDPLNVGYSSMTDKQVANSLNTKNISQNRKTLTGFEIEKKVVNGEYAALTDVNQQKFLTLVSTEAIHKWGFAMRVIKAIFPEDAQTIADLETYKIQQVSRAYELGLSRIKAGQVQEART